VHVALKVQNTSQWYFDSGCSRHITDDISFFIHLEDRKEGKVTFGGGSRSSILGRDSVEIPKFPKLDNVLYMKNLSSISQLCDANFVVKFDRSECSVYDQSDERLIQGVRTVYNCYRIIPKSSFVCNSATVSSMDLWH